MAVGAGRERRRTDVDVGAEPDCAQRERAARARRCSDASSASGASSLYTSADSTAASEKVGSAARMPLSAPLNEERRDASRALKSKRNPLSTATSPIALARAIAIE